jgi:hypothetical protein
MTAEQRYEALRSTRDWYLQRGREAAMLTLPYVIPSSTEPGRNQRQTQVLPWSGVGARGVNNLASRLMLAILPPTDSFFRFLVDELDLAREERRLAEEEGKSQEEIAEWRTDLEQALSRLEQAVLRTIETTNDRVVIHETLMHLVVSGNALLYLPEGGGARVYHLNRYVVEREPGQGRPLEVVIREEVSVESLSKPIREAIAQEEDAAPVSPDGSGENIPDYERTVYLCTHIRWDWSANTPKVKWHQEVKGRQVENSEVERPVSESPWLPLRMISVDGESYGPGYVEAAAIADLATANSLTQAVTEGALIAAQIKYLVRPGGSTNAKQLADTPNGGFCPGNPDDVSPLQAQKSTDLAVAASRLDRVESRLSQIFMLPDVRDSERTTAEEVRLLAQEIENSLGGVYSILSVELQAPYIRRKLALLTSNGDIPSLPEGMIKPVVSVGLAAVGRGNDAEKTVRFMSVLQGAIGPEALLRYVVPGELIRRLAYSLGINTMGLVKSDKQLAAEAAEAQKQAMAQQVIESQMVAPDKLANAAATVQEMQAGGPAAAAEAPP